MISFRKYVDQILNEAIPLGIAKKSFTRKNFPANYTEKLNRVFNNKDRIILPFQIDMDALKDMLADSKFSAYVDVFNFLFNDIYAKVRTPPKKEHNYTEEEWAEELKKQLKTVYHVDWDSYIKGYAYESMPDGGGNVKEDKRKPVRIGKLLQKYNPELLKRYKEDPARQTQKEYVIVISRHPYDIAGASTDRNWTSCYDYNFDKIVYKDKKKEPPVDQTTWDSFPCSDNVENELPELIAYLVPKDELRENGKIALHKPISRISIKGYVHKNKYGFYIDEYDPMYGVKSDAFLKEMRNWIKENGLALSV